MSESADKRPDGWVGVPELPDVRVVGDIQKELKAVWSGYEENRFKVSEAIDRLEERKTRTLEADLSIGTRFHTSTNDRTNHLLASTASDLSITERATRPHEISGHRTICSSDKYQGCISEEGIKGC